MAAGYGDSLSQLYAPEIRPKGYFRQRGGQSPPAVRASAKRSGADATADSSLKEGALGTPLQKAPS